MKFIRKFALSLLIISLLSSITAFGVFADSEQILISTYDPDSAVYSDIGGGWYEDAVIAYGYPDIFSNGDGCFYPEQAITRMEFARMLHEALGISVNYLVATDIGEYFDDVSNEDAGAGDLYDLVTLGIIDKADSFSPSETIDRDEMIHIVMNAFYNHLGSDYALSDIALPSFADSSDIANEYCNDVNKAHSLGLINGSGDNLLLPNNAATRAEAVTTVGRLTELLQKYDSNVVVKASAVEEDGRLNLTLTIQNNTDNTVTINHTSTQQFDFGFEDAEGNELYRWSTDYMFNWILTTTEILPGEITSFSADINAETYATIKDDVSVIKAYIAGTSSDFEINTDGYIINKS